MSSCLGIYIGDKIIKYAKLAYDGKSMHVDNCGVKHAIGEKIETIENIIAETGSSGIPIALNMVKENYSGIEILKQISKNDMLSMMELEIFEIANKMGLNEKLISYRYLELKNERESPNNRLLIATTEKQELDKYTKAGKFKVNAIYPLTFVLDGIVDKNDKDYIYVNIDDTTDFITVQQGEIKNISKLNIGMLDIISGIANYCGSTAKAYELCKSINIYTDDTGANDPEIEKIIEPILQDLLHRIEEKVKTTGFPVNRIYISGMGTLFTNIDLLFEEYFSISSKVVKPYFASEMGENNNISEIIETSEAIALAHEYLLPQKQNINFLNVKETSQKTLAFKEKLGNLGHIDVEKDKFKKTLIFANVIAIIVLLIYMFFGMIYSNQTNKMEKNLAKTTDSLNKEIIKVQSDIDYIVENTKKYSDINEFVEETTRKIEGNEIGKYSTYNVANFMQKIVKYIPKGVQIMSIASDDNKNITMIAKSTSYAYLGYFVSQLKLQGILTDVEAKKVEHTGEVIVTIGGVLP